jgi:hypothetical protein
VARAERAHVGTLAIAHPNAAAKTLSEDAMSARHCS